MRIDVVAEYRKALPRFLETSPVIELQQDGKAAVWRSGEDGWVLAHPGLSHFMWKLAAQHPDRERLFGELAALGIAKSNFGEDIDGHETE